MRTFRFHSEALEELRDQAVFYEARSTGLGERFADQVEETANLAASMPGIGSPYIHRTRRVFPKDFPYSTVYREFGEAIVILLLPHSAGGQATGSHARLVANDSYADSPTPQLLRLSWMFSDFSG